MRTISVAMATYNGSRFIREQLDSLATQTYLPSELVVTDDGSTDNTIEIIEAFSLTAPFPVHIHRNRSRLNYRANFMKCANLCSSELIAFSDQDDIWDQDKLGTLVQQFENDDVDLVFHDVRLVDTDGNPVTNMASSYAFSSTVNPWTVILGLTQVFRRKLLRYSDLWELSIDQQYPSERLAHDQWFVFLAHSLNSLRHIPQPLLSYRQHATNVFGLRDRSKDLDIGIKGNLRAITNALFRRTDLARTKKIILCKQLTGRSAGSTSRLNVLKEIHQRENGDIQLLKQIELYRTLGDLYDRRASIYSNKSIIGRLWYFFLAVKNGAYKLNARGLKDIFLDIAYGVCVKPLPNSGRNIAQF
jgi:glycosyltransferase involved in cell wall biosynthesis